MLCTLFFYIPLLGGWYDTSWKLKTGNLKFFILFPIQSVPVAMRLVAFSILNSQVSVRADWSKTPKSVLRVLSAGMCSETARGPVIWGDRETAECYQAVWLMYFIFHLCKACPLKVIVLKNRSRQGNMTWEVHVLLPQAQSPWSDVPLGFTQWLNVGSLVPPEFSVRWQTWLSASLAWANTRFSWNSQVCPSFGTLRFRHPFSSLYFPPSSGKLR